MIVSNIKKIVIKTKWFNFFSWLFQQYRNSCSTVYSPSDFRSYGKGVFIGKNVNINHPERVIINDYVTIGHGAIINSKGGLYIGKYTGIGFRCIIWTSEHHYRGAEAIPFDNGSDLKPVIIRDFVWIGSNVKIIPGREIGEGAIVGMGAVVVKDVPPLAIIMGNPAEIVAYRDKKHFMQCKANGAFQSARVGEYHEKMFPMCKRRFKPEIEELGLTDL